MHGTAVCWGRVHRQLGMEAKEQPFPSFNLSKRRVTMANSNNRNEMTQAKTDDSQVIDDFEIIELEDRLEFNVSCNGLCVNN